MAWMGSKSSIAAITALNTSGLEDGIVYWAVAEKLWLGLSKSSTATVDNASVWEATPAGRWLLVGGSGGGGSSVEVVASLAALQALPSASQDKLYALNTTPPQAFIWDAESTATPTDDIIKLTALTNGRMYRFYPVASSGGGGSNLMIAPNIATITALNTTSLPDGIQYYAIEEKRTLVLTRGFGGQPNDVTCFYTPYGSDLWYAHPNTVIVSDSYPPTTGSALIGTTWIWAEAGHESDRSKSVITYVWGANANDDYYWVETASRPRIGFGDPTVSGTIINGYEFWIDVNTKFLYHSNIHPEFGGTWYKILT